MNAKLAKSFFLLSGFCLLQACDVKSPLRQDKAESFDAVTVEGNFTSAASDPQINILFVVDNSGSMKPYQEKLAENIELFANEFFDNARLDYRIGVVPVYDSRYLNDKTEYRSGYRKMNALGELVPLKGLPFDQDNALYITRETPSPKDVLKQTVLIGTQWGPEAEESFSPVLAVVDPEKNKKINKDFYLPDAHLAVIFLTDADDATLGLSGQEFYQTLVKAKNGNRSKVLIAAALPSLAKINGTTCKADGNGPVQKFPQLLAVSGAIYADLCSDNFGEVLASFGKLIKNRVASQKVALGFTPDIDSLTVTYGSKEQPASEHQVLHRDKLEYTFLPETNEVVLDSNLKLRRIPNGKIWVTAKPAKLGNEKNGRLNTI